MTNEASGITIGKEHLSNPPAIAPRRRGIQSCAKANRVGGGRLAATSLRADIKLVPGARLTACAAELGGGVTAPPVCDATCRADNSPSP
jgi:hypothetical protein